ARRRSGLLLESLPLVAIPSPAAHSSVLGACVTDRSRWSRSHLRSAHPAELALRAEPLDDVRHALAGGAGEKREKLRDLAAGGCGVTAAAERRGHGGEVDRAIGGAAIADRGAFQVEEDEDRVRRLAPPTVRDLARISVADCGDHLNAARSRDHRAAPLRDLEASLHLGGDPL